MSLKSDDSPLAKMQKLIIGVFNLDGAKELGSLCGVSDIEVIKYRQTIDDDVFNHLFGLSKVARSWRGYGYPAPSRADLNEELLMGPNTLLEALSERPLDPEKILFIGSRLNMRGF